MKRLAWVSAIALVALALASLGLVRCAAHMPGESLSGPLPAATPTEVDLAARLRVHVAELADAIGPRDLRVHPDALGRAADYVAGRFRSIGLAVDEQRYGVGDGTARNVVATLEGSSSARQTIVIGAHYDTVPETPGADDNASGVAALLEVARLMAGDSPARAIRFVAFANEEPPYYHTDDMGSVRYARSLEASREDVVAMVSLEMLGYYDAHAGTQHYPALLASAYSDTGDFVAVVGKVGSGDLVRRCVRILRERGSLPAEGAVLPASLPGVGWSDHWSFWRSGYPAVMITDTGHFRNPSYHEPTDIPESLDYDRLARAVEGIAAVVRGLAAE